jgi:hypothetical protein
MGQLSKQGDDGLYQLNTPSEYTGIAPPEYTGIAPPEYKGIADG